MGYIDIVYSFAGTTKHQNSQQPKNDKDFFPHKAEGLIKFV